MKVKDEKMLKSFFAVTLPLVVRCTLSKDQNV